MHYTIARNSHTDLHAKVVVTKNVLVSLNVLLWNDSVSPSDSLTSAQFGFKDKKRGSGLSAEKSSRFGT